MKPLRLVWTVALTAGVLVCPAPIEAQVRGSERSQVSQMSDATTVTIDYARPHVRGRRPVFGGMVGWGHVWTPGANEATTFEADKDVTLNGVEVPSGRYSMWMIPDEGEWEVVLDPNDRLYHTEPPGETPGQIRFPVAPESSEFTEALTFDFPLVEPTGMTLRFRWATTSIAFSVGVQPSAVLTVSDEQARQLVGEYDMTFMGPPPPGAPPGMESPTMLLTVVQEGDRLQATIVGGPPGLPNSLMFIPAADLVFNPAWMLEGEVFETEVDMYFEFNVEDGQASGFDVRGLEDRLMMRGTRKN